MSAARRSALVCVLAAIAVLPALRPHPLAAMEIALLPAFPDRPLRGPQKAKGAVIWSHGKGFATDVARLPGPDYLALLRDAGWDVFRQNRTDEFQDYKDPHANTTHDTPLKAAMLSASVDKLKADGYRRLVLVGQSYGAWLSLVVAGKRKDLEAVLAMSPAAYGTFKQDPRSYQNNASYLYDFVDEIAAGRILIAFFRDDPYEPEDRGPRIEQILSAHKLPHLVIHRPESPIGHSGANGRLFVERFGACVVAALDAPQMPRLAACERPAPLQPTTEIPLPANLAVASSRGGGAPIDKFLGRWFGVYANGREIILVVEKTEGDVVHAVYAYGPIDPAMEKGSFTRREGRLVDGKLVFDKPGLARLEYTLQPDGTLGGTWSKGKGVLTTTLHRLAPS